MPAIDSVSCGDRLLAVDSLSCVWSYRSACGSEPKIGDMMHGRVGPRPDVVGEAIYEDEVRQA